MLKSMTIDNFIHFAQPQRLIFHDGINFIIGGNSSGKTAVFELIRRCLSKDLSTTKSSIPDKNQLAYSVCHFNTPKDKMSPWEVGSMCSSPQDVLACLFVTVDKSKDNSSLYYKILYAKIDEEQCIIFGQKLESSSDLNNQDLHSSVCFSRKACVEEIAMVEKIYNKDRTAIDVQYSVKDLFKKIEPQNFADDETLNTRVDKVFAWLTESYVGVLPMRSVGPLQWTRSRFITNSNREKNYQKASSHAEILTELLDERNTNNIEWEMVESFRKHLLISRYRFRKQDNLILVDNEDMNQTNPRPLLKILEGIVEAEQLILLLAEKRNLTLTLEEPDRGMHPHMINRLRDLVLKKIEHKTVLVVSHNPSILDNFTIDRTYLCTKSSANEVITHTVRTLPKGYRKYGMIDEMKALLFSERVLFVEGFTDQIIVEAIFDIVINETCKTEGMEFLADQKYKDFITSLHVIELREGKGAGPKKMRYCKEIELESFVLYDFDVVFKKLEGESFKLEADDIYKIKFKEKFKSLESFRDDQEALNRFERACEDQRTFIWIDKAIEDVINKVSSNIDPDIAERLDIPIGKKKYKNWKHSLVEKEESDIKLLAKELIQHSDEVIRFLQFLSKMMPCIDNVIMC